MGRIGVPELIFIGLVIVLFFGAKKLPEIGSAFGKALREFKKAGKETQDDVTEAVTNENNEQKS